MSKKACLIRTNDGQMPLVDILTIPDDALAGPDPEASLYALIASVARDYALSTGRTEPMEPVDFIDIPEDFLATHGISVEPVDVPASILLDMSDILFDPDDKDPDDDEDGDDA